MRPVEVGCRGFVANSTTKLLRELGIRRQASRRAIKEIAEAAKVIGYRLKDEPHLDSTPRFASNWLWGQTPRTDHPAVGLSQLRVYGSTRLKHPRMMRKMCP